MTGEGKTSADETQPPVVLSRWVNEPYPSLTELLSAHDVARLTRRPRWMVLGLTLIGQFPARARFRGRKIGWRRIDVLEWMARDLALQRERGTSPTGYFEAHSRQSLLPLGCRASGGASRRGSIHRTSVQCEGARTPDRPRR